MVRYCISPNEYLFILCLGSAGNGKNGQKVKVFYLLSFFSWLLNIRSIAVKIKTSLRRLPKRRANGLDFDPHFA